MATVYSGGNDTLSRDVEASTNQHQACNGHIDHVTADDENQSSNVAMKIRETAILDDRLSSIAETDNLNGSTCFTSNRLPTINRHLPKHVRKYYKKQNSVIDAYEELNEQHQRINADSITQDAEADRRLARMTSIMSKVTFALNLALLVAKCVAVGLSGSLVIISSMLDSAMDLVSGALMWWSNRAIKKTDYYFYPRGRRKLEPVAIVVLAVIMSFVSVQVIHESIQKIVIYLTHGYDSELQVADDWLTAASNFSLGDVNGSETEGPPGDLAATALVVRLLRDTLDHCSTNHGAPVFEMPTIVICVVTILTKLVLFLVCRRVNNPSVQALAKDHFNDVLSNTGAVACGIIGYRLWKYADPLGAIVISLWIIINWSFTAHSQVKLLTGYTARPLFLNKITWIALRHDDRIRCIERVIAFHFGVRYLVEVHIVLPAEMTMRQAHDLSEALQLKIERLPEVERAFVHTDYECDWLEPRHNCGATQQNHQLDESAASTQLQHRHDAPESTT